MAVKDGLRGERLRKRPASRLEAGRRNHTRRDGARTRWRYRVNTPEGGELPALGAGAPFNSVPTSPFGPEIPGGVDVAGVGAPSVPPAPVPGAIRNTRGATSPDPLPCAACVAVAKSGIPKRDMRIKALNIVVLPSSLDARNASIWAFPLERN